MKLQNLGYNNKIEKLREEHSPGNFEIGRVIAEHRERYTVSTEKGELEAEVTGNLRFSARSREDFPAAGDWVSLIMYDTAAAIIHGILPRSSVIKRQAVGQIAEVQIIATNVDYAFLVQAADRDFNINRLERYLTICYSSKVTPVIVLTKTDLIGSQEVSNIIHRLKKRIENTPVLAISNTTRDGYQKLEEMMKEGKTYCMMGSSGVGKSTLLNNLSGKNIMKTDAISESTHKGRHITSHRELTILQNGAILIDNPGMREVGITDTTNGLETTFDTIEEYSHECRFRNCTHTNEKGCRVIEAVERGEIDESAYDNFLKMEKEKAYFDASVAERRKKDKDFGKMIKNFKKDIKQIKPGFNEKE